MESRLEIGSGPEGKLGGAVQGTGFHNGVAEKEAGWGSGWSRSRRRTGVPNFTKATTLTYYRG